MVDYQPKDFESKWQEYWQEKGLFTIDVEDKTKPKYYCLVMFPYPSSELHVGHARNYVIGDAVARYKAMRGFYVLAPMGWDAFGLPAENQAIKNKIHPKTWTLKNIERITDQLKSWGIGYDWDKEVTSCEPDYYKWTQWIFLKLYEAGLAYKKYAPVNFCSSCKTVLANEQVIEGCCERCSTEVEEKKMEQWFLKITDYTEHLLCDLDLLTDWPQKVKIMQENWIGKSLGVEIDFPIIDSDKKISCFTTRVDTIFGATYVVLAPEHTLIKEWIENDSVSPEVVEFVKNMKRHAVKTQDLAELEKEGVFTGKYAINPMTDEKIPIYTANYVLISYGTGSVMAVPTHDERDFEFAKKYDLPMRVVIDTSEVPIKLNEMKGAYEGEGILVNSGEFNGLKSEDAKDEIARYMEEHNIGRSGVQYKLRDWLISRQRYWGAPIPIIYCDQCGTLPVAEKDLPVILPEDVEFKPTGDSPLKYCEDFVNTKCPKCGGAAKREVDTMDTFVDSSWYYLRYITPRNKKEAFDTKLVNKWLPVDQYIGGIEHATMHLIYARFITKALFNLKLIDFKEPFAKLFTQGMIIKDGVKMSKSKGNVVAPDALIEKYGVDTMRLYILFMGPPEKDAEWSDRGVEGAFRFLNRFWRLYDTFQTYSAQEINNTREAELNRIFNLTIKKVTIDMEGGFKFNTAISFIMELLNQLQSDVAQCCVSKKLLSKILEALLVLIYPFAPHISEELWQKMGKTSSVLENSLWPECDESALIQETIEMPVQINGKLRGKVEVANEADEEEIREIVLSNDKVKVFIQDKLIRKFIVVKKRVVNIVI
ncbi:MAG: leucine--tRNA ligase [Candidatus Saelkia tenebricola]|nr:leucine--tRNA ligase [Candidatus Saelkia tenebricola]